MCSSIHYFQVASLASAADICEQLHQRLPGLVELQHPARIRVIADDNASSQPIELNRLLDQLVASVARCRTDTVTQTTTVHQVTTITERVTLVQSPPRAEDQTDAGLIEMPDNSSIQLWMSDAHRQLAELQRGAVEDGEKEKGILETLRVRLMLCYQFILLLVAKGRSRAHIG